MEAAKAEHRGGRRDAQRNHELLVDAAREVFSERGVDASLEEIARRAGLGIGTLYRHFPTREALVGAIFERRIGKLVAVAESAAEDPDGWGAFCRLLEHTVELQAGDRVLKEVLMRHPPAEGASAETRETLKGLFARALERAQEQGTMRDDFTVSDLALLLWSFGPLIDATAEIAPNAWRRHLHWLLDGLRAGSATASPEPALDDEQLLQAMTRLHEQHFPRRPKH